MADKNALGVFSVGVPENGLATGAFVMFSQGRVFTGTIQGTADPDTAKLRGVLSARFDFRINNPSTGISTPVTASLNGDLNANIVRSRFSLQTTAATRLRGTADTFFNPGLINTGTLEPCCLVEQTLKVRGFKQSDTATVPTAASPPPLTSPPSTASPTATPSPTSTM